MKPLDRCGLNPTNRVHVDFNDSNSISNPVSDLRDSATWWDLARSCYLPAAAFTMWWTFCGGPSLNILGVREYVQ